MLKTNIIFLLFFTFFIVSCNNNSRELLNIDYTKPIIENIKEEEIIKDSNIKLKDINLTESKNEIKIDLNKDIKEKTNFNSNESHDVDIFYENELLKIENNGTVQIQEFVLNDTKVEHEEYNLKLSQNILNKTETKKEESKAVIAALELFSKPQNAKPNELKVIDNTTVISDTDNKSLKKIALLIPTSGQHEKIGASILKGVELAYFENSKKTFEIIVFDTNQDLKKTVNNIIKSSCSLVIGPVFSGEIKIVKDALKSTGIPILSFSNDVRFRMDGVWLLGQLLKDEINLITDYIIDIGFKSIAILGSNNEYGKILTKTIKKNLRESGAIKKTLLINETELEDLNLLRSEIKYFTGWKKLEDESTELPEPNFDAIILAGNKNFIIKTAPLLSYYDHGPDRTFVFGNSQMAQREIFLEPSLNGAYFSSIEYDVKNKFAVKWRENWGGEPQQLSALGYDIVKILIDKKPAQDLINYLIKKEGHNGFTGKIWLSHNGLSKREVFLHKIENKKALQVF